jgi:hypothetical protein
MLIFGEFNVFRPADARSILNKVHQALKPAGLLLLEPHTFAAVRKMGSLSPTWYTSQSGLFSAQPYLSLEECHWNENSRTITWRYYIVDADTHQVTRYAQSMQAYSDEQYRAELAGCGFGEVRFYPSLAGETIQGQEDFFAIATKRLAQRAV